MVQLSKGLVILLAMGIGGTPICNGPTFAANGALPIVRPHAFSTMSTSGDLIAPCDTVIWGLPTAHSLDVLNEFTCTGATQSVLNLDYDKGFQSWTIAGSVQAIWRVEPDRYALFVQYWPHTPIQGMPLLEELKGLDLGKNALTTLWSYHGKVFEGNDGIYCGVVISWNGRHYSLRADVSAGAKTTPPAMGVNLFVGTNTCT